MTPDLFTALRDWSLGAVAIVAMAWILVQIMRWQLEERRTWTARVEQWATERKADNDRLVTVMERTATVLARFEDCVSDQEKDRDRGEQQMAAAVKAITDSLAELTRSTNELAENMAQHRRVVEKSGGKRPA